MQMEDLLQQARDLITVKRVFGEPYEKDGVMVIPVASVRGGGGGGSGDQGDGPKGTGGGMGISARPVGAYQIKDGELKWVPAIDVTRIAFFGQLVAVVALLVVRSIVRKVARRR